MKSSGVTLEEIRRLFKVLEESKSNNGVQILIDNEMCKQFQDIIETICSSKDKKDKEIERLNNIIKSIKEEIESYIDITIDHLETNNEEINFELRNKCRAMREIKEELLNIIEKELKEGKE